ncbi:glutamate--tRNA ligase family protein [Chitinophaga sedimenti]|uniref:glutamate--tRNA ligase family protein n=1 Tax=Chitinophaga sedimenti TaxID=2033606 RepID=UPI0035578665
MYNSFKKTNLCINLKMLPQTAYHKTRIAPTPSGFLHLGNILSFAITADLAQRCGAITLLRIDDMDRDRAEKNTSMIFLKRSGSRRFPGARGPGTAMHSLNNIHNGIGSTFIMKCWGNYGPTYLPATAPARK